MNDTEIAECFGFTLAVADLTVEREGLLPGLQCFLELAVVILLKSLVKQMIGLCFTIVLGLNRAQCNQLQKRGVKVG